MNKIYTHASAGVLITREARSNRVGVDEERKLIVSVDTDDSGRLTMRMDLKAELKSEDTVIPLADIVMFTVASDEASVVAKSSKAVDTCIHFRRASWIKAISSLYLETGKKAGV